MDLFSWTLIVLFPSRQHSFSDGEIAALTGFYTYQTINSSNEDTNLQDTINSKNRINSPKMLQWNPVLKSECLVRIVYRQNYHKLLQEYHLHGFVCL